MTALAGLKIVDFSRFLPAAYATWVAADMGADVVRIEHPRELAKAEAMLVEKGVLMPGDTYAITCGEPMGHPGGTNMLKVCQVA